MKQRCRRVGLRAANLLAHFLLHMATSTGNKLLRAFTKRLQKRSIRSLAFAAEDERAVGRELASRRARHLSGSEASSRYATGGPSPTVAIQSCITGSARREPTEPSAGGPAWRAKSIRLTCNAITSNCCSWRWYSASWARIDSPLRTHRPLQISAAKRSVRTEWVRSTMRAGLGNMSDQSPSPSSARSSKFMQRMSSRIAGRWKDARSAVFTTWQAGDVKAAERAEYHSRSSSRVASGLRQ
mmetsp:Transcript_81168/g.241853  ORF Transcript_81168/g.241853 Transcript_81168/m.241853 type:complete len:241 (-) Transcript_81168:642-1364(-)